MTSPPDHDPAPAGSPGPLEPLVDAARALADDVAGASDSQLRHVIQWYRDSDAMPMLRGQAQAVNDAVTAAAHAAGELSRLVNARFDAWHARTRFEPEALRRLLADLRAAGPAARWRRWAEELITALSLLKLDAAAELARMADDLGARPPELDPETAATIARWRDGDLGAGQRAVAGLLGPAVLQGRPAGPRWLSADARRKLAMARAWLAAGLGDRTGADSLLASEPDGTASGAAVLGELAALRLQSGDPDAAREAARRVVEDTPDEPRGYLVLGAAAEGAGDYDVSAGLYATGCARLSVTDLVTLGQGVTFLQPTGLLQLQRARRLADLRLDDEALSAVDAALGLGLAGVLPHPEADAHALRARILDQPGIAPAESAAAALEAGRRYLANGQLDLAVDILQLASRPDVRLPEAGWALADAMTVLAYPRNAAAPDAVLLARARDWWDGWAEKVGSPAGKLSWAYLTRALIESLSRPATAGAIWRALLFAERCLVGDPDNARGWGLSARMLRALNLRALASESAAVGSKLNPGDDQVLSVGYALMADFGRYDDALQALERMPDKDAYLASDRAWLLLHVGRSKEAVDEMSEPISLGINAGANLIVRALCYASDGRFDDALRDLRDVLEVQDADPTLHYRRAYALAALRDAGAAEQELAQATSSPDESITSSYAQTVSACVQLARGATDQASVDIGNALASAGALAVADDAIINVTQMMRLLEYQGADVESGRQALARAVAAHPPASATSVADEEFAQCWSRHLEDGPGSIPIVALNVIRSRRLARAGDLDGAARGYQLLRAGPFEPEASTGLARVLAQQLGEAVTRGDVDRVRLLFGQLSELNAQPCPVVELAVAEAQAAADHLAQALATLRGVEAAELDADWQVSVQVRLGVLALQVGEPPVAAEAFRAALSAASGRPEVPQLLTWTGVSLLAQGDRDGAAACFDQAIRHWSDAGALDPAAALEREARVAAGLARPAGESLAPALDQALAGAAGRAAATPG